MQDKVFVDTNILIYCYSNDERDKQLRAQEIFTRHEDINISKQVINEFVNVLFKKFLLDSDAIKNTIYEIGNSVNILDFSLSTQIKAVELKSDFNLQFYDSLIIATALENSCNILYSEDMQDGLQIDKLRIVNPLES